MLAGWTAEPFLLEWHMKFNFHRVPNQKLPPVLSEWIMLKHDYAHIVDQGLAAEAQKHRAAEQDWQLESGLMEQPKRMKPFDRDAPALLDVEQVYLEDANAGDIIINVTELTPHAEKKMVDGKEMMELCDDGIHRVVWQVPRLVDGEWQCL